MNSISPVGDIYSSSYNHNLIPSTTVTTPLISVTECVSPETPATIMQSVPSSRQADDQFGISQNICPNGNDEECNNVAISLHQPADNRCDSAYTSNSRNLKRCNDIAVRSSAVPNKNIDSFDFDGEVRHLRGLYKLTGTCVGPFRIVKKTTNDTIAATTNLSNEW